MKKEEASRIVGEHMKTAPPEFYEAFKWHTFYRNLNARNVELKNEGVNIDDMTPNTWKTMSKDERGAWQDYWRIQGHVSFCCRTCQFPVAFGGARCDCCESKESE